MARAKRDLSLRQRKESQRDSRPIAPPLQFSLGEIRQHYDDSMESIKSQFEVTDMLSQEDNMRACETIWRSQVAFSEALLDFYIHEISKYCLFRMFTGQWEKTEKYSSIMVPMGRVEDAINATESKDWFFSVLSEHFSRMVFMSCDGMREQLNLIGIGFAAVLAKAFPSEKEEDSIRQGKDIIKRLFDRRNRITHQFDRSHESAEQEGITKDYASEYISNVEKIVDAIHEIAEEKG